MKTTTKQTVTALYTDGLRGHERRTVKTVSYWKDSRIVNEDASDKAIREIFARFHKSKCNDLKFVLTAKGNLFLTNMTPGYCSGDVKPYGIEIEYEGYITLDHYPIPKKKAVAQ